MKYFWIVFIFFYFTVLPVSAGDEGIDARPSSDDAGLVLFFTQEKISDFFDAPIISSGYIAVNSSGDIRWQTEVPYKSVLILKSGKVFQFEFFDGKAKRLNPPAPEKIVEVSEKIRALVTGNFDAEDFDVSRNGTLCILRPKRGLMQRTVKSIKVVSDPDGRGVKSIEILNIDGDTTRIVLTGALENPPKISDAFKPELVEKFSPVRK